MHICSNTDCQLTCRKRFCCACLLVMKSLINSIFHLHSVKLLLKPSSTQTPVGIGDTKETSFCNVTEDVSISDTRKGLFFWTHRFYFSHRLINERAGQKLCCCASHSESPYRITGHLCSELELNGS